MCRKSQRYDRFPNWVIFDFCGLDMSENHVKDPENSQKNRKKLGPVRRDGQVPTNQSGLIGTVFDVGLDRRSRSDIVNRIKTNRDRMF